ncbi:type II toxin-antitoxin system VapC family toxin [Paracoccus sp. MA]|uniref:type II toxin-antitoxin system VapC family toxin n=1 Tax=unclassified Paracoccus (in: a-proteobacteria) TaxID=2688777 RepID=UPI001E4C89D0|nr:MULTISPECIES: type II toxin-antitoxin system VapC family toxin [unclassified Paracoccus (in: a-proteobacteria)]UFM64061.1 type II toxin-antitoxin system VapC family toxin [Paracoccus sp. MA]
MLVIDASALIAWVMPDESGVDLASLAERHEEIGAPWLLWAELRNILVVNERRGRLPAGAAEQIIEAVDAFGVRLDTRPAHSVVMDLARRHGLTVYDALYLELALRQGSSLTSLDAALIQAAQAEGVAVEHR